MKEGRIVIIGIDALEYDLVEEWDLKYLKQESYCKTDLSNFDVITSPAIWAAILTGRRIKEIEEIFLKREKMVSQGGIVKKLLVERYLIAKIAAKILPMSIKKIIDKGVTFDPFEKTYNILVENRYTTIFDFFKETWNNGIPSYGRNVADFETKRLMSIAVKGDIAPLYNYSMNLYYKEKQELLSAFNGNYDLIFWYSPFLDEIEHFYITKKIKLLNIYLELNNFAKTMKEKLRENERFYIISDHGMEPIGSNVRGGDHSDHGFFSSNTGESIKKPQDLFYLVKNNVWKN